MGYLSVLAVTIADRLFASVFVVVGILVLIGHNRLVQAFEAQQRAFYEALGVKFLQRINNWMTQSRIMRGYFHVFLYIWGVLAVVIGGYGVIFGLE